MLVDLSCRTGPLRVGPTTSWWVYLVGQVPDWALPLVAGGALAVLEPAAGGEVRENAGDQQDQADGEGTDDPVEFDTAFEHETVKQGEDQDKYGCLGKEGRAAMRGHGDKVEEWGGTSGLGEAAAGGDKSQPTGQRSWGGIFFAPLAVCGLLGEERPV
jgi:hypothetical protein